MDNYLDIEELARRLRVPVTWIYDRTRKSGTEQIPHYKFGKYVRFLEKEVLEYLKTKSKGGAR
ncbi:MAG: helix-turn-helix domain-containing protein [bacterium]|nr:helix-turn-helix domain-containing protein [bacterium]